MENIIYGLRDPRNDLYYYIGKSSVGNTRALSHLTKSHLPKVNEWVKELESKWLYVLVDLIEVVEDLDNLPEREIHWINYYYQINPELFNVELVDKSINEVRTKEDELEFDFLGRIVYKVPSILQKERLARNITQEEMAKKMGVNRWTISNIENGNSVGFKYIQKYVLTLKGIDIKTNAIKQRVRIIT